MPNTKPKTDAERLAQMEADAARAREIAEETAERYATRGSQSVATLESVIERSTAVVLAKTVREWVRSVLVPPALLRLHDIGHGLTRHEVATMVGTVMVPPSASVQVKALTALVGAGLPSQVGLVDADDNALPGVFALGELELANAREAAHGDRAFTALGMAGVEGEVVEGTGIPASTAARVERGELEVVEVEEGVGVTRETDDRAPGPIVPHETTEQRILRERRERKAAKAAAVRAANDAAHAGHSNGNGNGAHG